MSDRDEAMAFVGFASCGHMRAATVDEPNHKADVARFVGQMIRDGLRVERMTCAEVRAADWGECDVCDPKAKRERERKRQTEMAL